MQRKLKMVKKQFSLTVPAYGWLVKEAKKIGVSASEFLRRVVDQARS
jgi:hypothetical protein